MKNIESEVQDLKLYFAKLAWNSVEFLQMQNKT